MRRALMVGLTVFGTLSCGGTVDLGQGDGGLTATGGSGGSATGGSGGATGGNGGTVTGGNGGICNVIAAGDLPVPTNSQTYVTGPDVTATATGFVIGYREQVAATLSGEIDGLSDQGELATSNPVDLGGCLTPTPLSDGVGVAFEGNSGLYASSLPNCSGSGAGSVFILFDDKGAFGPGSAPKSSAFDALTVAQAHSVAPATAPGEWEFVYRIETGNPPVTERVVLQGEGFKSTPVHLFGETDVPFAMVSSTPQIRAFLGFDANQAIQVLVGPRNGDTVDTTLTLTLPQANQALLTTWSDRVAAAVPQNSTQLSLTTAELGPGGVLTNKVVDVGAPVLSGAMAALGDNLYVLAGVANRLVLYRVAGATGTPQSPTLIEDYMSGIGAKSLGSFDGMHVAMAAARDRIVIVWRTKWALSPGDPAGGYAVLSCAP